MNREIAERLAKSLAVATKEAIKKATAPLLERIDELEQANLRASSRVRSLELASEADGHRIKALESQLLEPDQAYASNHRRYVPQ
jgi:hypothetical protein